MKYYIRYVDYFVILGRNKIKLNEYRMKINEFLKTLELELQPGKSRITALDKGVCFLGFRNFYRHRLLKKNNISKMNGKMMHLNEDFELAAISYDKVYTSMEGWLSYVNHVNTYKSRMNFIKRFEVLFQIRISNIEINRWLRIANLRD